MMTSNKIIQKFTFPLFVKKLIEPIRVTGLTIYVNRNIGKYSQL